MSTHCSSHMAYTKNKYLLLVNHICFYFFYLAFSQTKAQITTNMKQFLLFFSFLSSSIWQHPAGHCFFGFSCIVKPPLPTVYVILSHTKRKKKRKCHKLNQYYTCYNFTESIQLIDLPGYLFNQIHYYPGILKCAVKENRGSDRFAVGV